MSTVLVCSLDEQSPKLFKQSMLKDHPIFLQFEFVNMEFLPREIS